jgi:outer membrane protein assembly factor BamA
VLAFRGMLRLQALAVLLPLALSAVAAAAAPETHAPSPTRPASMPSDAELERSHALIGAVIVDNKNIFDLDDPKDDNWLFRLADHLHARTRKSVIRSQLLFRPGDRYDHRLLEESERILRQNQYFYDASIRPVAYRNGRVDVQVSTRDVWTLNPGFNFHRSGGTNTTGGELQDLDFFGTGTNLLVEHSTDVDRTINTYQILNQHVFDSWVAALVNYSHNSDGNTGALSVVQPFYALDSRWSAGASIRAGTQNDFLWDLGDKVDEWQEHFNWAQAYYGWSSGLANGWVERLTVGATFDEHDFDAQPLWTAPHLVPDSRKLIYPYVQLDVIQDDYVKLTNHEQIARTEDFYLGLQYEFVLGYAARAWGSNRDSVIFSSSVGSGFSTPDNQSTLILNATYGGRIDDGSLRNATLTAASTYFIEQSRQALFFTTMSVELAHKLDLDNQLLLGGDSGLRGYPLRYQGGDGRALTTVEERYFTDWYPFRLWRVGAAIFADVGRTWGNSAFIAPSLGWLEDAGFGLRFGNARSGLGNVTHVDIAFPVEHSDGIKAVQFLVTTQQQF